MAAIFTQFSSLPHVGVVQDAIKKITQLQLNCNLEEIHKRVFENKACIWIENSFYKLHIVCITDFSQFGVL